MSVEIQDRLIKLLGFCIFAGFVLLCVKLLPDSPEVLAIIVGAGGTLTGGLTLNSPIKAVRRAKGLVSIKKPSDAEAEQMRAAVVLHYSQQPPPLSSASATHGETMVPGSSDQAR
jgi:hypothetical protein